MHREIVRALVAKDEAALRSAWVRHQGVSIRTDDLLTLCVTASRPQFISVILDLGGKPDKLRSSLLATLLIRHRPDDVKLLVKAGAPVNNESGDSEALEKAVRNFHSYPRDRYEKESEGKEVPPFDFSMIELLLQYGAQLDPNLPEIRRSETNTTSDSTHWLETHYSTLFSLFEKYGAQFRSEANFGEHAHAVEKPPPIEQAIMRNNVAQVKELLSADPHILTAVKNPLTKAILSDCSLEMVRCLLTHNCDVHEDGEKPLLATCPTHDYINPYSTPYILRFLLQHGAKPSMRDGEAFLNACERFPDSLGVKFFEANSVPNLPHLYDAALLGLLGKSELFPELGLVKAQEREDPVFKLISMAKSLVDRGADPYTTILLLFRKSSLAPFYTKEPIEMSTPTSHYGEWRDVLRERLEEQLPREVKDIDDRFRFAGGALSYNCSQMQLGDDPRQRASLSSASDRYCHLMAQALEPANSCWINSLIGGRQRKIPEPLICPSLLAQDSRYKMVSDVAAIATVLYRPFALRQKFIDLAKATFSDEVKLKDSQERNESVFEWLPVTKRMVTHFADLALLPALWSYLHPDATPYLTRSVFEQIRKDLSFVAAEMLLDGRSLREIRDFTKKWHGLSDKHPIPLTADAVWNPILREPLSLPNGFVVKDLHSIQHLREIGTTMKNCLVDGVHAPACFHGRSRILAIFKDDVPVVALTLEERDGGWHLTEYEGPDYARPDEGPDAPLTHFKQMLAANEISFLKAYKDKIPTPNVYDNETSDGLFLKYANYLDNNRSDLVVNYQLERALQQPGIDAAAFYIRWVVLTDKRSEKALPLLRDEKISTCRGHIREMAEALSLYLTYSQKLYAHYPDWAVKNR